MHAMKERFIKECYSAFSIESDQFMFGQSSNGTSALVPWAKTVVPLVSFGGGRPSNVGGRSRATRRPVGVDLAASRLVLINGRLCHPATC
eukprot:jgi/Botrbrau1/8930/Bobra.0148s0043.1